MPELPEVETSVQAIQEFASQNLESIKIYNPNLRWKVDSSAFYALNGMKVKGISRRAKYILIAIEMTIGSPFLLKWNSAKIIDRNNPPNIADKAPRKALFAKSKVSFLANGSFIKRLENCKEIAGK